MVGCRGTVGCGTLPPWGWPDPPDPPLDGLFVGLIAAVGGPRNVSLGAMLGILVPLVGVIQVGLTWSVMVVVISSVRQGR